MGLTFKENCPDLRNTKVIDVIRELESYGAYVEVFDPCCYGPQAKSEYGITLIKKLPSNYYDGVMVCVAHSEFKQLEIQYIRSLCKQSHVIFDLKHIFRADETDARL